MKLREAIRRIWEWFFGKPTPHDTPQDTPHDETAISDVKWDGRRGLGDVGKYTEVFTIENARVEGHLIKWDGVHPNEWPKHGDIKNNPNAILVFIVVRNGVKVGVFAEWLLPNMNWQDLGTVIKHTRSNGKKMWADEIGDISIGEPCWLVVVSTKNRERSNVVRVSW